MEKLTEIELLKYENYNLKINAINENLKKMTDEYKNFLIKLCADQNIDFNKLKGINENGEIILTE